MTTTPKDAQREKTVVALSSVGAAIGLVSLKIIVALLTGALAFWLMPRIRDWTWWLL